MPIQQQKGWEVVTFAILGAKQKAGNIQDSQNSETRMPIKWGRDWDNSYRDLTNNDRNCSNAYAAVCNGNVRNSDVHHCINP